MTRKQTMRILTMLLVCIILLNFISQPKAEAIGGSLALALGGTSAAKAFLAFIMSCIAMGVTYSTYDQAKAAYDHYIENSTMSTEDLRYIQQETWTGNYEGVTSDISDMKDAFVSWLTGLFGSITTGENVYNPITINSLVLDVAKPFNLTSQIIYCTVNSNIYKYTLNAENSTWYDEPVVIFRGYQGDLLRTGSGTYDYLRFYPDNQYTVQVGSNGLLNIKTWNGSLWTSVTGGANIFISSEIVTEIPLYTDESIIVDITTDAPILNPAYSPQNRIFPAAPYLPYIDFDNEKVGQSISASGGTMEVYNGTYDQYLDDIVENATWEDIQGISAGTVPTTTLTETSEGLIIGEATAGIPYPIPDTTAPGEVLTGLGGIMGLLQGITNWIAQLWNLITGIFEIPEGLSLDFSSLRLEGFKDKFPFSIPWDIYRAIAVFAKTPETPEFTIDIETDYLNIDHTINLDPIDLPLRFARYVMSIFFIFFLASKTRDLIKW